MSERHTIEFDGFGANILSDGERGTISLQFDVSDSRQAIRPMLNAIRRCFGHGIRSRLTRWMTGQGDPLLRLTSRDEPHPDNPDVIRVEMRVKEGVHIDSALAALIAFFRRQPGYRRTLGPPLDRDDLEGQIPREPGDAAGLAQQALRRILEQRHRGRAGN